MKLVFDRYHRTMLGFALSKYGLIGNGQSGNAESVFYLTQRKLRAAPCVGHERLLAELLRGGLDRPRARFLKDDKAGLFPVAELVSSAYQFNVRCVRPGTIMFANEPFADVRGPFALTQLREVLFQHAFDEPMTVAGNALAMRLAAGERGLSDFSLRRDGSVERACEIAKFAFIGGFNDSSNMEAAFLLDINAMGTMAHFLAQLYHVLLRHLGGKHPEQYLFEKWLDAHPKGTTLLVDTISVEYGVIHAIKAALSLPARTEALKFIRIDSFRNLDHLVALARWTHETLCANGLGHVKIIITGDMDAKSIEFLVKECPFIAGFGVGTKLAAETKVAGVIFKLCSVNGIPTQKLSATRGKGTLPGEMQVWRGRDRNGFYVKDIICSEDETPTESDVTFSPLLEDFWKPGQNPEIPTIEAQKAFVDWQMSRFRDINNYPVEISPSLSQLQRETEALMLDDPGLRDGIAVGPFPD